MILTIRILPYLTMYAVILKIDILILTIYMITLTIWVTNLTIPVTTHCESDNTLKHTL